MLESITLHVGLGLAILPDMDMTRNGILGLNSAFVVVVSPSLQSSGFVNSHRIVPCLCIPLFLALNCVIHVLIYNYTLAVLIHDEWVRGKRPRRGCIWGEVHYAEGAADL